ncbi:MAG: DNA glycosylase AlkZ-like family protein [Thermomicrobiales bacterium]
MTLRVTREQVLRYRMWAQGLHRETADPNQLAIFDLGVQDSNVQSARTAIAIRLQDLTRLPEIDTETFTMVWSHRGSPHLHRSADLPQMAAALWPLSERDAMLRLAQRGKEISQGGRPVLEAWELATRAMQDVVVHPRTKGEAIVAMTSRLPEDLSAFCRGCNSTHIFDSLMRAAGLPAGVANARVRTGPALVPEPIAGWSRVPASAEATTAMIRTFLELHGPANQIDVAAFLGSNRSELAGVWPADVSEIIVDGKSSWITEACPQMVLNPPTAPKLRLLPLWDPFLHSRDRSLLVPDKAKQKLLWTMLASPGALMVNGEVAGTWRAKMAARRRLEVRVKPFEPLESDVWAEMEQEAQIIATACGAEDVTLLAVAN